MFERFTDRARRVVVLAQEEANRLRHHHIGTEHMALALVRQPDSAGAQALEAFGITYEKVAAEVDEQVEAGTSELHGHIPFTPNGKRALEQSLRASLEMSDDYIGTEHLLLGVLRVPASTGAQVLLKLGADLDGVRAKVEEGDDEPRNFTDP